MPFNNRPETPIEAVAGTPAMRSATVSAAVDYETDAPLVSPMGCSALERGKSYLI